MDVFAKGIDITSLYDFDILFWNCFDSVVYVYFGFHIYKEKRVRRRVNQNPSIEE